MFIYHAGKRRRRGSIGAFTRVCSASVVKITDTSFQNTDNNLSSAHMILNVLMVIWQPGIDLQL